MQTDNMVMLCFQSFKGPAMKLYCRQGQQSGLTISSETWSVNNTTYGSFLPLELLLGDLILDCDATFL
jgi:hypothetical protein